MIKKYSDVIHGLDIETSTITIDSENQCSFMYSCCLGSIDTNTGVYNDGLMCRTYNELDNILNDLNNRAKKDNKIYIVYVHNFSYEHSFFINNLKFFKSVNKCLYLDKNKPLYIQIKHLEFRDSLALLDKSIKRIGDDIGIPKLDYNYNEIRTPLTPLTDEEIKYNYRDVEIMLKGVYRLINTNQYIDCVDTIPLTKTGVSRLNSKKNDNINTKKYIEKSKRNVRLKGLDEYICNKEKAINEKQLKMWEDCFLGGFVFSNPYYCNKIVKNVASADFSSSYPTQMIYRYFPYNFYEIKHDKLNYFKKYLDKNFKPYELTLARPVLKAFNVKMIVNNIVAKYNYYTLSTSRIENFKDLVNLKNCYYINGKLTECNINVTISFTFIDYMIFKLFYDFNIVDIEYLEITNKWRKSSKYRLNCVVENGKKKLEFKNYNNLVLHNGKFKKYTKNDIDDDYFRGMVNNQKDYVNQRLISGAMYLAPKSDLNSQYGDNAQHLLHSRFEYNYNTMDYNTINETYSEYYNKRQNTSYIYGVYIVAYARASLCYNALIFLNNGIDIIYTDTDSFKYKDSKKADKLIIDYNNMIDNLIPKEYLYLKFGYLDKEEVYNKFITLGTKSYISYKDGNITATISGLPKATLLYQTLLNQYNNDFDKMIKDCYHYDVIIKSSCVNKLASVYKYKEFTIDILDYKDTVISGCILKDVDVTLRSMSSKIWFGYALQLKHDFKVNIDNFKRTYIIKNEDRLEVLKNE